MKANIGWQRGFNSRERWMRKRISKRWKKKYNQMYKELKDAYPNSILWRYDVH